MPDPEIFDAATFDTNNLPANRKDWDKLREADPVKWGELTQSNMDRVFRQNKVLEDKAKALEAEKNNLSVELNQYKVRQVPDVIEDGNKEYSTYNLPKT